MNKKERLYSMIMKHGQNLKAIFNLDPNTDPVQLSKRLFRLENKAHRLALDFCNGNIDQLTWDNEASKILDKVQAILKNKKNIFVNGDARGYALKIDDNYIRVNNFNIHRDWGGYGIIAPDFKEIIENEAEKSTFETMDTFEQIDHLERRALLDAQMNGEY
jgi:hypothetical protein